MIRANQQMLNKAIYSPFILGLLSPQPSTANYTAKPWEAEMGNSLRVKWVWIIIFITTACLSIAGIVNYTLAKEKMKSYIQQQNLTSVQNSANHLTEWLSVRYAEAGVISRTKIMKTGSLGEKLDYLRQEVLQSESVYYSAGIADLDGNLTLTTGQSVNVTDEANFQAALKGERFISDPIFGKATGEYIVTIYVPVTDEAGNIACLVDIAFDAKKLFEEQVKIEDPDNNGRVTLMHENSTVLYSPDRTRVLQMNYVRDFPVLRSLHKEIVTKKKGYASLNFEGQPIFTFYSKVPKAPWYLLYSIPQKNLEQPLQSLMIFTISIIAFTELIVAGLIFAVLNSMIIQRIRQLLKVTEAVAGGNLSVAAIETNSRDELGALASSVNGMTQNLRDLFQPFESFIQNNRYAMIVINEDYRVVSFNTRAEEMLGFKAEQIVQLHTPLLWLDPQQLSERANAYSADLGEPLVPDCRVLVVKPLRKLAMDQEWTFVRSDGTKLPVNMNVSPMTRPDGTNKGFVLLARDISTLVQAAETSNRLQQILDAAQDFIASFDLKGNMFYINGAGRRLLDIDVLDEESRRIGNYLQASVALQLTEGLVIAQKIGHWENETEFITKKGHRVTTSLIVVAHQSSDEADVYFSMIVRDIRDSKQIQLELVQAKEEADRANHAKSLFLARMSHEIRTPLNGIIGLSYLMQRTALTDIQKDYQSKISISSQMLLQVINDILDFSKIEADKLPLEEVSFNLDETIRKLSSTLSVLLGNKQIDLMFRMEGEVPAILMGDPLRLGQILLNLTSNAIKFTESGSITLLIRIVEYKEGEITIRFSVTDTGIGMKTQQVERLFQPFMQADESTSRKFGGTGLGLNISKNLIEKMGGILSVQSVPGAGSTFTFTLRFKVPSDLSNLSFALPINQNEFRVAIVEDSAEVRTNLAMMLGRMQLHHAAVAGWEEAFVLMDAGQPPIHALLLDMEAEDMYGEESWLRMKQTATQYQAFTLVYTSLSGRDALLKLPDHQQPDAILLKPVNRLELYQTIATLQESLTEPHDPEAVSLLNVAVAKSLSRSALLVEDNTINQVVAKQMMESRGLTVTLANNGLEALKLLTKEHFDIILMDVHMPELDGVRTTEFIRGDSRYAHIPIIALTADTTKEQYEKCLRVGMNGILTKPLDPEQFMEALTKWLPGHAAILPAINHTWESTGLPRIHGMDMDEALYRMDGKVNLVARMTLLFRDEHRNTMTRLKQIIREGNLYTAQRMAHSLQGAAGNLAMKGLFVAALTLEDLLHGGMTESLEAHLANLESRMNEVLESIAQADFS
jgi:two-component system sensor histidine kinase/response regulator